MRATIFHTAGITTFTVLGLYSLYVSWGILAQLWDPFTAFLVMLAAPVVLALLPWYMLLVYGSWSLLIVVYGGGLLATFLYNLGSTRERAIQ